MVFVGFITPINFPRGLSYSNAFKHLKLKDNYMARIICISLDGGLIQSNIYTTPKGNEYLFQKGCPTDVRDPEDIEFFVKKAGNGKFFKRVDGVEKVKKKVKEVVKGKEPEVERIEDGSKDGTPNPDKKWTEKELYDLNKVDQIKLIQRLGGSNSRIPRYEKDRVKMILKLQGKPEV